MAKAKKGKLTIEDALVPVEEQPYEIPENWCWTFLSSVADWGSGGTPSRKNPEYYEGDIPWIKTGELEDGYIFDSEEKITEDAIAHSSAKLFPIDSVLIAMYGATIGKTAILGIPATTNQACACARCNDALINKYLFYYLRSQKDSFIAKGKGGAQPNISQDIIKGHPIPLPPLAEQKRIVEQIENLFSKLDEAKEKVQNAMDSFEIRRASILHDAFCGKLSSDWRKENNIVDEWTDYSIGDILKVSSGKSLTAKNMCEGSIPVYGGNGINGYHNESNIDADTLVIGRVGFYCGVVHHIMESAWVTDNGLIVKNNKDITNNRFLYYLLSYTDLRQNDSSTAQPVVSGSKIYPIMVKIPNIDEQKYIAEMLEQLLEKENKTKNEVEFILDNIDLMKKAILAKAFRGKLGTNFADEESSVELLKEIFIG